MNDRLDKNLSSDIMPYQYNSNNVEKDIRLVYPSDLGENGSAPFRTRFQTWVRVVAMIVLFVVCYQLGWRARRYLE